MANDDDIDAPEPDLAQLLVLEAGRIIEDLTPALALRLPEPPSERGSAIDKQLQSLIVAKYLLAAAQSLTVHQFRDTDH